MVLRIAAVLTSSDAMQDAHSIQRQKKNYGVNRLTSVQLKEIISVRITTKHCGIYRIIVIVVSGMQLLRLHSAIHRHHPPQRVVLSQICCFGERKAVLFQILLDGAEPRDARTT